MISRRIEISSGLSTPSRLIVSVTFELGAPRIFSRASSRDSHCTVLPFSAVMMSPALIPALEAGVPSIGLTTLTKPFSWVTSIPRPANWPVVCISISRNSAAFM